MECDLNERAGTYLKTLTCRFRDEGNYVDHGRMLYTLSREWFHDWRMDPVDRHQLGGGGRHFRQRVPDLHPATRRELRLLGDNGGCHVYGAAVSGLPVGGMAPPCSATIRMRTRLILIDALHRLLVDRLRQADARVGPRLV